MLAESLYCFEGVLEALEMHLEIMAQDLELAEEGTFEVHHNLLGGNHMLAIMAHNLDIHAVHLCLVVSVVPC
jgi:hypothetical protein